MAEAAGLGQLELKRSFKSGSDRLFIAKPGGAGTKLLGRREALDLAGNRGIAQCYKPAAGCEIYEPNLGLVGFEGAEEEKHN